MAVDFNDESSPFIESHLCGRRATFLICHRTFAATAGWRSSADSPPVRTKLNLIVLLVVICYVRQRKFFRKKEMYNL